MTYQSLMALLEALLFAAGEPVTLAQLCDSAQLSRDDAKLALDELTRQYQREGRGLEVRVVAGGYQLATRPHYASYIQRLKGLENRNTLSQAALETLAIIAYKQPLTRSEVEQIRGVRIEAVLQTLVDRGLVQEVGRHQGPGKPILYGTTAKFLNTFGLRDLQELPKIPQDNPN